MLVNIFLFNAESTAADPEVNAEKDEETTESVGRAWRGGT